MNVKRFTGRTSRDALALVRQAFGDDAVVMSTRPCADGVEVVAMAADSVQQLERVAADPVPQPAPQALGTSRALQRVLEKATARTHGRMAGGANAATAHTSHAPTTGRIDPTLEAGMPANMSSAMQTDVQADVQQLQMSTLSFQDFVRQRMLKRRGAELAAEASAQAARNPPAPAPIAAARQRMADLQHKPAPLANRQVPVLRDEMQDGVQDTPQTPVEAAVERRAQVVAPAPMQGPARTETRSESRTHNGPPQADMLTELRSMRGLIEQRFGALAFMEKLQRQPRQAQLAQRLLDAGFSPALIRKLADSMPMDVDETVWASGVLEHNLHTGEKEHPLEEVGGVYALIGATGVGKTTSTAKLAAAFATRHGAANLGLITLDAYRVGAHEQLRTYGRILGVPVHTAHDRASLEDLLDLLSGKRMVLIDTAGMAQRDSRTRELLEMVSHRAINRLLVVNASAQGETIEDQLGAYAAQGCRGVILSKLDEAVKLGPAIDAMVRHKLKVLAVANGQRVPEDWHRLSANALVQRALKGGGSSAWKLNDNDVSLIFAGLPLARPAAAAFA
jgi:flagellar biosynthesis protein FlhF